MKTCRRTDIKVCGVCKGKGWFNPEKLYWNDGRPIYTVFQCVKCDAYLKHKSDGSYGHYFSAGVLAHKYTGMLHGTVDVKDIDQGIALPLGVHFLTPYYAGTLNKSMFPMNHFGLVDEHNPDITLL